jgi:Ca2+/Na+ antiporter
VEYIIGAVFVSAGFGSSTPAVPAVLGAIVMLNAAIATGPAAAFQLVHRRVHRILDLVVMGLVAVAVVQPWVDIDGNARLLIGLLDVVLAFVWWNTDFATKDERKQRRRRTPTPDAEQVGRSAGRSAAETYLAAKRLKKAVIDDRRSGASADDGS